jgi:hypothetical protein
LHNNAAARGSKPQTDDDGVVSEHSKKEEMGGRSPGALTRPRTSQDRKDRLIWWDEISRWEDMKKPVLATGVFRMAEGVI